MAKSPKAYDPRFHRPTIPPSEASPTQAWILVKIVVDEFDGELTLLAARWCSSIGDPGCKTTEAYQPKKKQIRSRQEEGLKSLVNGLCFFTPGAALNPEPCRAVPAGFG